MNNDSAQDNNPSQIEKLRQQVTAAQLSTDLQEKLLNQLDRTNKMIAAVGYKPEFDKELEYVQLVSSLPFNTSSQDILDLKKAAEVLNKNHFGMQPVKDHILEYMSALILNHNQGKILKAPILAFVGLVGSGKTSLAYSIAEAVGRKMIRIPFGGLGSASQLRGQSRVNNEAEPGLIVKSLIRAGVNNPVILLDELDRVATETRTDVMGVLVEMLDPEQNFAFMDHYLDHPFDLSKVLFVATANNTGNIATAVLDRMELIEMPSYSDEEKIVIGKDYLFPKVLEQAGLPVGTISVDANIWPQIVRPLGFDGGIRSLQRNIQTIVRKVARLVVEGKAGPFVLNADTIKQYIS